MKAKQKLIDTLNAKGGIAANKKDLLNLQMAFNDIPKPDIDEIRKNAWRSTIATPETIGGACMSGKFMTKKEAKKVSKWVKKRKKAKPKKGSYEALLAAAAFAKKSGLAKNYGK